MFGLNISEDEQAQLLKDWLRRNLLYIAAGLIAVFASIGGYSYYTNSQQDTSRYSTELLFQLVQLSNHSLRDQSQDAATRARAIASAAELADALGALDATSFQAGMGRIQHARLLLAYQSDYAGIEAALGSTLTSTYPLVSGAATLLLANAAWANDQTDQALQLLDGDFPPALQPLMHQLAGDIYIAIGDKDKAVSSYAKASAAGLVSELLSLKQTQLGPIEESN